MERRVESDSDITWEEYKSMKFTSHVCAIYRIVKNKQKLSNVSLVHGRIQSNSYLAPDILSTSHIYIGYSKHRSGGVQTIKPGRTHKGYVYMHLISTMCSKKFSTRVWYSYRNRSVYISSLWTYALRVHYPRRIKDHDQSICCAPEFKGLRWPLGIQSMEMEGMWNSYLETSNNWPK